MPVSSLFRCYVQVERSPESCRTHKEHLHIWVSTSVLLHPYSNLCSFEHLVCVPLWHLLMDCTHEKGCIVLHWPVTPRLKLGAKNHLALRRGEKKKCQKSISTQSEYGGVSKEHHHGCSVSSGETCLCHCVPTVCANLDVWTAGVEANFKTNFMFVCVCAGL